MAEDNEIDTDYYENLVENCIWQPPERLARAVGLGIILKQSDQYGFNKTQGGIIVPGDKKFEKKYNLCEVVAVGELVPKNVVDVGDIALIQRSTAFRLPNGIHPPGMWRVMYDTMHVIAVYPNLVEARLSAKYKGDGQFADLIGTTEYKAYAKRYAEGDKQVPSAKDIYG